jgi:hypothetical protein
MHNALNSSFFNPYYKVPEIIDRNGLSKETFLVLIATANEIYTVLQKIKKII